MKYFKPEFEFVGYDLDDVITKSSVVTTKPETTVPASTTAVQTTSGNIGLTGGTGDGHIDYNDIP